MHINNSTEIQEKDTLCRCWMLETNRELQQKQKKKWSCLFSHLSIQQCHRDVAIDMAPPRAQSGELHGGGRWEGGRQGGRLCGKLELVAAAEMPHLGCCSSVTASQRQGHLVVVRDLCRQGNLR